VFYCCYIQNCVRNLILQWQIWGLGAEPPVESRSRALGNRIRRQSPLEAQKLDLLKSYGIHQQICLIFCILQMQKFLATYGTIQRQNSHLGTCPLIHLYPNQLLGLGLGIGLRLGIGLGLRLGSGSGLGLVLALALKRKFGCG